MLNYILVENEITEDSLTISMKEPEQSGFYIESIEGLGPADASIITMDMVSMAGSLFNTSRVQKRNIVLNIGMYENNIDNLNVEELRVKSYRYFPIGRQVKLEFNTELRSVYIYGYVEKNQPNIFAEREKSQISIVCPNPWFKSKYGMITSLTGPNTYYMEYSGDVDTGIEISLYFTEDLQGRVVISNSSGTFEINNELVKKINGLSSGIIRGDIVNINTNNGTKSIFLKRGDVSTSLLNIVGRNHNWIQIHKGGNDINISSPSNFTGSITAPILYEGI